MDWILRSLCVLSAPRFHFFRRYGFAVWEEWIWSETKLSMGLTYLLLLD